MFVLPPFGEDYSSSCTSGCTLVCSVRPCAASLWHSRFSDRAHGVGAADHMGEQAAQHAIAGYPRQTKNRREGRGFVLIAAGSGRGFCLPLPSPPAEQAATRQHQTRQASASNGTGYSVGRREIG